ncbi:proto-oncogene c-Fos-like [Dendronephthya gigantea]|uniref:proto-oncogene c-Fos-like n=1 Tax=Dendronephthya gigantea TaxID=151771 RepID=UPI00106C6AA4|nr:proto-oncogene c-Fos-like [Dendronephthya gigantea]
MMANFIAQFGQNCNLDYSSVPMFQNENLDTSSLYAYTDWVRTPRPCKDVLRQAIRVSRIKKGQEMPVIDKSSTVPHKRRKPMQGDIPKEMLIRRQKNREAAKKCRLKKRKNEEILKGKIQKYKDKNSAIENEIKQYRDEVSQLQSLLQQHNCKKDATKSKQHCPEVTASTSSQHSAKLHKVPTTAEEEIAGSIDDLLTELQDDDGWCEELVNFM